MAPPPDTRVIKGKRITREALQRLGQLHLDWVVGRPSGKRAMLEDCDLTKLDLSHMNFSDGVFIRCRFDDSEGRGVKFVGAILRSSSFDRADLTNADFQRADLSGAVLGKTNLSNADLRGASFRQAEMTGVVLAGATMIDSDFSGAVLDKSMEGKLDITCASGPAKKKLDSGKLGLVLDAHHRWVLSLGTEGSRANLAGLDLSGIDLSGRNLAAANFNGATLAETCLEGAWLMAADFRTANLLRAKLGKVDLRGADFTAAHQRGLDVEACVIGTLPGSTLTTRGLQAKIASRA